MAFKRDRERENLTVEQIEAFLQDAISKVKANPEEYEELRKVYKNNVRLGMRSFVAAYILKQASGAIYRFNNFKNREDFRSRKRFEKNFERNVENKESTSENRENSDIHETRHERYQHIEIGSDVAATVFVGVGKNRRVYPKDIVGLFISVAGLEKERIGDIKVYANYSFVQLFKEDADKAINALNGYDYRGRKLSVSFSRQRVENPSDNDANYDDEIETKEDTSYTSEPVNEVKEEVFEVAPKSVEVNESKSETKTVKSYSEMTDEEILAMRAPRSSSTSDIQ